MAEIEGDFLVATQSASAQLAVFEEANAVLVKELPGLVIDLASAGLSRLIRKYASLYDLFKCATNLKDVDDAVQYLMEGFHADLAIRLGKASLAMLNLIDEVKTLGASWDLFDKLLTANNKQISNEEKELAKLKAELKKILARKAKASADFDAAEAEIFRIQGKRAYYGCPAI